MFVIIINNNSNNLLSCYFYLLDLQFRGPEFESRYHLYQISKNQKPKPPITKQNNIKSQYPIGAVEA